MVVILGQFQKWRLIIGGFSMEIKKGMKAWLGSLAAVLSLSGLSAGGALANDELKVRFSWKLKGEYAHFYVAQDRGLYAKNNLKVTLGEGAGSQAALGALIQGQEHLVVLPGAFALTAIQKGMPIRLVALYHPSTPMVYISHPENPVTKPSDLEGKKLAHSVGETGTTYLDSFCARNKIDCSKITKVTMAGGARVPQFIQRQVDVVSAYQTNDLPMLEATTGKQFPQLDLVAHGLKVPGMAIVASDRDIQGRADQIRRFLAATNEAIRISKSDTRAASVAMTKAWNGAPDLPVLDRQVRATMDAIPEIQGRPLGWVDTQVIREALELINAVEKPDAVKPVDAFFTNSLLGN
jgi:NitT/TauT family transport system substrate-binding protein